MNKKRRKGRIIREAGLYPITLRHLDYLTEREFERYVTTGKTPFLWWLRVRKRHNGV